MIFKIKYKLLIASMFWQCLCQLTFAQEKWPIDSKELTSLGIKYEKPKVLEEVRGSECFENNPLLKKMMQCGGNILQSKDGRFIAFNMIGDVFYVKDTVPLIMVSPGIQGKKIIDPFLTQELTHLRHIRDDIKQFLDEKYEEHWKGYIHYYNKNEVRKRFNADTIISYSFHLKQQDYYKGKYKNLWVLVRQKKNRPSIRTYCLYEDLPKKKLSQYKTAIENVFKYDEGSSESDYPLITSKALKSMGLIYEQPLLFYSTYTDPECFSENPKLNSMFSCVGGQLRSKNNRFIVFFPAKPRIITQEFNDRVNKIFPNHKRDLVDKQHVYQLKKEIRNARGEEAARHWKDYVNYFSSEEALRKFNADTVITYTLRLKPQEYYKKKYANIWALTLQKKDRGYITLHCFYEDMPQKELDKYKAAVESIFRYED